MEIHAYNKLYLENAMSAVGIMLDYAVNYRHWEIDEFFQAFLETKLLPQQFESGHPDTVAGKSGVELYLRVTGENARNLPEYVEFDSSPEYWVGWALSYCKWHMNRTIRIFTPVLNPDAVLISYPINPEVDILSVVDAI